MDVNLKIALLRGINVSGKNLLKMTDLVTLLNNNGFRNVRTYIQSGNLLFIPPVSENEALEKLITSLIKGTYGYEVPVMVLDPSELSFIVRNNPFIVEGKEADHLHVTILNSEPSGESTDSLKSVQSGKDEWKLAGLAVYLFCPNGYGQTKLTNTLIESKLKCRATTRNWKTMNVLLNMAMETD